MPAEIANILGETLSPSKVDESLLDRVPSKLPSLTLYNIADPRIAWRSIVMTAQKQTDPMAGKIISEFSNLLFEPYGIRDPEAFLSGVDSNLLTVNFDTDGEKPMVIATFKDYATVKNSIATDLKPKNENPASDGPLFWNSPDSDLQALFFTNKVVIGDGDGVQSWYAGCGTAAETCIEKEFRTRLANSTAPITTISREGDAAGHIADVLSENVPNGPRPETISFIETRFTKTGIERRTISDFGLIGSIIAQLNAD